MTVEQLQNRFYPDLSYNNGTEIFYSWIRSRTSARTVMLNLGAGSEIGPPVRSFRGEVARVVGADIDRSVLNNPGLDEAYVCGDTLPFGQSAFDVVVSDYVLEHVAKPRIFMAEVHRVLKPDGSFFFRTPNLFHYVSIAGWLLPHHLHLLLANRVRGLEAEAHDPYPTYYRLNTAGRVRREARRAGFGTIDLRLIECEPVYLTFNLLLFLTGVAYERLVNKFDCLSHLRCNIFGRLDH
jgi:SAM-dependent methyltransferase